MSMYRLLIAALAGLVWTAPSAAALTIAVAAPPPAVAAPAEPPAPAPEPRPADARTDIPGGILFGMAAAGLAIVGIAARRRQSGRSVTS